MSDALYMWSWGNITINCTMSKYTAIVTLLSAGDVHVITKYDMMAMART